MKKVIIYEKGDIVFHKISREFYKVVETQDNYKSKVVVKHPVTSALRICDPHNLEDTVK